MYANCERQELVKPDQGKIQHITQVPIPNSTECQIHKESYV